MMKYINWFLLFTLLSAAVGLFFWTHGWPYEPFVAVSLANLGIAVTLITKKHDTERR
jgi:hypothetical protein